MQLYQYFLFLVLALCKLVNTLGCSISPLKNNYHCSLESTVTNTIDSFCIKSRKMLLSYIYIWVCIYIEICNNFIYKTYTHIHLYTHTQNCI